MTQKIIIANWKMSVDRASTTVLARAAGATLGKCQGGADVILCAPYVYLEHVAGIMAGGVTLGAQDVAVPHHPKGAQTGDVSPKMLRDIGCTAVIIGHSERRAGHGEVNDTVRSKVSAAIESGLQVILCVGDTADDRVAGRSQDVVSAQIQTALSGVSGVSAESVILAYEPVWAISGGGGRAATLDDIAVMYAFLAKFIGTALASCAGMRLVYGGSVNADNAAGILNVPHVDGVLVGAASLDPVAFSTIIRVGCAQNVI